jgi:hypothetical protein
MDIYPRVPGTGMEPVANAVSDLRRQTRALQRPDGTRLAELYTQVQLTLANISAQVSTLVAEFLAAGVSTTNITASGIIRSPATYSNPITSSFRAVWVTSVDGQYGFNLSSREFKQDISDFAPDPATILLLRLVTFRYIAAVELEGDEAETQVGLIAEEVHDLGLHWLVEYQDGHPIGIKFHLIAMALLAVAQDHEARLTKAGL